MLKPVNTNLSRHTILTGHLRCRFCKQYIKPTLTGHHSCRSWRQYIRVILTRHLSCRSCREYIKPTLTPLSQTLFFPHPIHQPYLHTISSHSVLSPFNAPTLKLHHQFTVRSLLNQYTNLELTLPVHTLFSPHSIHKPYINTTSSHSVLSPLNTPTLT
jgi:hypothetical protein